MIRQREEAIELLKQHGAVLARQAKHHVWKLPDGRTFVMPSTPGDQNGAKHNLSTLRKVLGVNEPTRGQAGERREKFRKTVHVVTHVKELDSSVFSTLREKLFPLLRVFAPRYDSCYPIDKQVVFKTPVEAVLGRIFR